MPPRPRLPAHFTNTRPTGHRILLPLRPLYQPRRHAFDFTDPKLHPNPNVTPSTDPSSPGPSSNEARKDSTTGHASSKAQSNVDPKGPNMEQLPHVTEEAAATSKSMGEGGPSMEQGTPVQDVLKQKGDKEGFDKLPKVMRDSVSHQKRSFSTSTRRRAGMDQDSFDQLSNEGPPPGMDLEKSQQSPSRRRIPSREEQEYPGQYHEINDEEAMLIATGEAADPLKARRVAQLALQKQTGMKFPRPTVSKSRQTNMKRRYDGVVEQVTNLIMRDGKKSVAQRNIAEILTYLRTHPAPTPSPAGTPRRLLPLPAHTTQAALLPLHPVFYLTHAIDSIAPLMRNTSQKGLVGGGIALSIPKPLNIRQRRRTAIVWILEACDKRKGGTSGFAKRFAEEIVGITEGKSGVWAKREGVHRMAVMGRSNLASVRRR